MNAATRQWRMAAATIAVTATSAGIAYTSPDAGDPERDVVARCRAVVGEPHVDVLVRMADSMLGKRIGLEQPADQHGGGGQRDEADHRHGDEGQHRMTGEASIRAHRPTGPKDARSVAASSRRRLACGPLLLSGYGVLDSSWSGRWFPGTSAWVTSGDGGACMLPVALLLVVAVAAGVAAWLGSRPSRAPNQRPPGREGGGRPGRRAHPGQSLRPPPPGRGGADRTGPHAGPADARRRRRRRLAAGAARPPRAKRWRTSTPPRRAGRTPIPPSWVTRCCPGSPCSPRPRA